MSACEGPLATSIFITSYLLYIAMKFSTHFDLWYGLKNLRQIRCCSVTDWRLLVFYTALCAEDYLDSITRTRGLAFRSGLSELGRIEREQSEEKPEDLVERFPS